MNYQDTLAKFPIGSFVIYGSQEYEVAEIKSWPRGAMVGVYDEPPGRHIDFLHPGNLEPVPPKLSGIEAIRQERVRQISEEGWSDTHDSRHTSAEMLDAAISYAMAAAKQARGESHAYLRSMAGAGSVPWPWEDKWWKVSSDIQRNIAKAGALLAAEIDRLNRLKK